MLSQTIIKESSIIRLRQATGQDMDYILETEHAPENAKYVIPWNRSEHQRFMESGNVMHLIVETADGVSKIGYLIVAGLENPHQELEFRRIVMAEKGKGYGREALRLLKSWAFEDRKAHRAWLDVKDYNTRARNLYTSEGFVEEGLIRECIKTEDGYESLVILGILEREYFALKK